MTKGKRGCTVASWTERSVLLHRRQVGFADVVRQGCGIFELGHSSARFKPKDESLTLRFGFRRNSQTCSSPELPFLHLLKSP